jgi:hypothetical protein
MLPRIMSQGPDASKDAESIAKVEDSSSTDQRATELSASSPSSEKEKVEGADSNPASGSAIASSSDGANVVGATNTDATAASDTAATRAAGASSGGASKSQATSRGAPKSQATASSASEPSPFPETEDALNVPKPQTIGMLGLMSALTLIAWFAARLACNAHPDQVREPKHFSTKDLAADPKNAAFEFHHGFETSDFVTALDLATGDARKLVEQKLKACEEDPDECQATQKKLAGSVVSTGRVLAQSGDRTTVELVSKYSKALQPKTFLFEVVKEGDYYRVATRKEVPNAPAAPTASAAAAQPTSPESPREPKISGPAEVSPPVTDESASEQSTTP